MSNDLTNLEESVAITEERKSMLDATRKRLWVDHRLTLHRDSVSAADLKAMIAHLEAAGMPAEATLRVDGTEGHTRMNALWSTQPSDRCVKCGGPDGFHDPACVIHPMDHQPSERES